MDSCLDAAQLGWCMVVVAESGSARVVEASKVAACCPWAAAVPYAEGTYCPEWPQAMGSGCRDAWDRRGIAAGACSLDWSWEASGLVAGTAR